MTWAGEGKRGIVAAWAGLRSSMRSPAVRRDYIRLFIVYALASAGLDVLGVWGVLEGTAGEPWGLPALVVTLVRWIGIAVVLLAAPLLAFFLVNLVFPTFGERLFLSGLRALAPERADALSASDGLGLATGIGISLRRLLRLLAVGILLFAWTLIPVVGTVSGPFLAAYFGASGLGWELLDPYFDKRQLQYREQKAFLKRHRPAIIGFSLPMMLLLAIPFVGPLFFGLVQASTGALALLLEDERERAATT